MALEPQPARALALLVSRCGEVVSRDELIAHVWGSETHVDFNRGLAYCVAQIRWCLGDSGESPRFVQTLPKSGFKFIAPVRTAALSSLARPISESFAETATTPEERSRGAGGKPGSFRLAVVAAGLLVIIAGAWGVGAFLRPSRPVVAVSLFDNETGDSQYDRAVHTMADIVVDRLTGLGHDRIGVVGNAAVLRMPRNERDLKRIEKETGASFVVLAQLQNRDTGVSLLDAPHPFG